MTADESNSNYWETGIKDTRSKRARISCEGVDNQEPLDFDVDTLSVQEIKEMLKERGVKTRFRYLKKLKKQLIESFKNKESRVPNEASCAWEHNLICFRILGKKLIKM